MNPRLISGMVALVGMLMAEPAAAKICVKSRIDKGAWFVARVEAWTEGGPAEAPRTSTTFNLAAGQEDCSLDHANTSRIAVYGANGPELRLLEVSQDCKVDIWGTVFTMYYKLYGNCGKPIGFHADPGT